MSVTAGAGGHPDGDEQAANGAVTVNGQSARRVAERDRRVACATLYGGGEMDAVAGAGGDDLPVVFGAELLACGRDFFWIRERQAVIVGTQIEAAVVLGAI